ncbi:hypothetical protein AtNW77_Chr3g0201371 [Arabidopsis thaliana]
MDAACQSSRQFDQFQVLYILAFSLDCRVWKIQPPTESPSPSVRKVNRHEARNC